MVPFCSQIQPIYRRRRAEIYPCPSVEIFVPAMAKPCRHTLCMASGFDAAGRKYTHARRSRFSSRRWRSRAAILCVWQADSTQPGGNIPVPVGGDFRPSDGEAVPPYFVYGKRIRRSWGGNNPDGGYIHMAKSLNTVPITLLHTGRCAMRSGVISAERDMVLSMSSSSASMAGTP